MPGLAQSIGQTMRHSMNRLLNTLMSLNDPQWGKRPGKNNSGPPDLEEVWSRVEEELLEREYVLVRRIFLLFYWRCLYRDHQAVH